MGKGCLALGEGRGGLLMAGQAALTGPYAYVFGGRLRTFCSKSAKPHTSPFLCLQVSPSALGLSGARMDGLVSCQQAHCFHLRHCVPLETAAALHAVPAASTAALLLLPHSQRLPHWHIYLQPFDESQHKLLCEELKHLYTAVTRAKNAVRAALLLWKVPQQAPPAMAVRGSGTLASNWSLPVPLR